MSLLLLIAVWTVVIPALVVTAAMTGASILRRRDARRFSALESARTLRAGYPAQILSRDRCRNQLKGLGGDPGRLIARSRVGAGLTHRGSPHA